MRLTIVITIFGVLSILLFTFHWIFKIMLWPMTAELKIGAAVFAALGGALWLIDHFILRKEKKDDDTDWEA